MKKLLILSIVFSSLAQLLAQDKPNFIPPNTILLYDNVYFDKTEIANIHWLEYLHYLKIDSSLQVIEAAIPDTTSLIYFHKDSINYKLYLTSPAFRYHPMVNISYEQAVSFGEWRSKAVELKVNNNPEGHGLKTNERIKLNYRLPTEKEWEVAAQDELDILQYPYGLKDVYTPFEDKIKAKEAYKSVRQDTILYKDFKKLLKQNKLSDDIIFNTLKSYSGLFDYGSYFPKNVNGNENLANNRGVVHLIGNISEMIQKKGVAKGGSYLDHINSISIKSRWSYDKPSIILGARYVCEVEIYEVKD